MKIGDIGLQKSKVLLISPLPPPLGGIATWTEMLMLNGLERYNISIIDTKLRGKRLVFGEKYTFLIEGYRNITIILKLLYVLVIERPKLLHISCSTSSVWGIFRDFCCLCLGKIFFVGIVIQHNGNVAYIINNTRVFNLGRKLIKLISKLANYTIVLNKPSFNNLHQLFTKTGEMRNIITLPLFLSNDVFTYLNKNSKSIINTELSFVYLGGITNAKGCNEILRLAYEFPVVKFKLIGWVLPDMSTAMENIPNNVIYLGRLAKKEEVFDQLLHSSCFLFPSHSEGFPLSVLEAMALGLPVIATNVGAIPEMIDNGKGGFVVDTGDFDALEKSCRTMISLSQEEIKAMGDYNQKKVRHNYTYEKVTKKLEFVYEQVISTD